MRRRIAALIVRGVGINRAESLIGALVVASAAARMRRDDPYSGDVHEVRHLYAALKAGDSTDCDTGSCILDRQALANWHTLQAARYDDPFAIRSANTAEWTQ